MSIKRIFVEKKKGFDIEAQSLFQDLKFNLGIENLEGLRLLNRYDISEISQPEFNRVKNSILSEPPLDNIYEEKIQLQGNENIFAIEYLPGQYDQRADSAAQCIQIISRQNKPLVVTARFIILKGKISSEDMDRIKKYLINPVDSREAKLDKPEDLRMQFLVPEDIKSISGFRGFSQGELQKVIDFQTEPWGVKVTAVEVKNVDLPEEMQRAIAKQAEAERERRAKIIHAEGEFQASQKLTDAANIIATAPSALQLRFLQTLTEIATEKNSTIIFPVPIDLLKPFMEKTEIKK